MNFKFCFGKGLFCKFEKRGNRMMNTKLKINFFMLVCMVVATLILSIGYANIENVDLYIEGNAETNVQDGVFITAVEYVESSGEGTENSMINDFYGTMLNSSIELSNTDNLSVITYAITVFNNTSYSYSYCRYKL